MTGRGALSSEKVLRKIRWSDDGLMSNVSKSFAVLASFLILICLDVSPFLSPDSIELEHCLNIA